MDKGLLNGIIFLDLKETFDCVDNDILIEKMYKYDVLETILGWFTSKSCFTCRIQICKVH